MNDNKISVKEYLDDRGLLEVTYVPFDDKVSIISHVVRSLIKATGGINSSMLRRISTEVVIESISNIDLSVLDENQLTGFDQLCYTNELANLERQLGNEYKEFMKILDEYISDYKRVETNPAITISRIYSNIVDFCGQMIGYISENLDDENMQKLVETISQSITSNKEMDNENK